MRLVDAVFRQGHLSESALVEAIMTGDRPVHLERCEICAERALELGRWLDDARALGDEAADAAFSPEHLQAQHAQIMRKLEQLDQPSRVIHFPSYSRAVARSASDHRVAPAWVGIAAAAGLAIGLVGGQITARLGSRPAAPPVPAATAEATRTGGSTELVADDRSTPTDPSLLDLHLDGIELPSLAVINDTTPSMVRTVARTRR